MKTNNCVFFFSSRRRHTRLQGDWSSDVCSSDLVRRTAADLALVGSVSRELDIGAVSLGYERALWRSALVATGLGARGTLNLVPEELRLFYGSRTPVGLTAYVQVRPSTDRRKV